MRPRVSFFITQVTTDVSVLELPREWESPTEGHTTALKFKYLVKTMKNSHGLINIDYQERNMILGQSGVQPFELPFELWKQTTFHSFLIWVIWIYSECFLESI